MRLAVIIFSMMTMNYVFSITQFYDFRILYWWWATCCLFLPAMFSEEKTYTGPIHEFFSMLLDAFYRTTMFVFWGSHIGGMLIAWVIFGNLLGFQDSLFEWTFLFFFFTFSFIGGIFGPEINRAIIAETQKSPTIMTIWRFLPFIIIVNSIIRNLFPNSEYSKNQNDKVSLILAFLMSPLMWLEYNNHKNLVGAFGEEHCVLVVLYEKNEDTRNAIEREAKAFVEGKTAKVINNGLSNHKREYFDANEKLPQIPPIICFERYQMKGFRDEPIVEYVGHYALFKGSKAFEKMRNWLKNNGYDNSDFEINHSIMVLHREDLLENFHKNSSELQLIAYFKYKGRHYVLTENYRFQELYLNSNLTKAELSDTWKHVKCLEQFAK